MDDLDKTGVLNKNSDWFQADLQRARDREACFIIIRGTPPGKRFELDKTEGIFIGRDASADVSLNDQNVSRRHAEVYKQEGKFYLRDNNSTNGTFINGTRIKEPVVLTKEDLVQVGNTVLKYLPRGELEIVYLGLLENELHSDSLTKFYNKGYIMEALEAEFKRAKGLKHPLCLAVFDLDHFKNINDTYGHAAGDHVLVEVARVIRMKIVDPAVLIGRFGGEEFLAILPNIPLDRALALAEQVRTAVERARITYEGKTITVTVSIGVADASQEREPAGLFKSADKAVYHAKNGGRNRVCAGQPG